MKTTRDIVEMFCAELDRAASGEVRKDVIEALDKCSNGLIKLARLEMDFAFREWGIQRPNIPWLETKLEALKVGRVLESGQTRNPTATTAKGQQLEKEIANCQQQLKTASATLKVILTDKIETLQSKLVRAEAENDSESDSE